MEQPSNDGSSMSCLDQNRGLLPYFRFCCVAPCRGMPCLEDHSLSTILLIGKFPALTSLLVRWSPHRDIPSLLFPFLSCSTPLV
jgi:hypothetical protein